MNLLVTPEELANAAGAAEADAKCVRDAFVVALLDELPEGKDLLSHAMDLPCHVDFPDVQPGFVAHLILSCIAAAESSSELARESSYRDRFKALARGRTSEATLHFLRDLWEKFQKWLASPRNQLRYRQLVLPPLGGRTRIGYSEGLAFPDRKDQRALGLLLRENNLSGEIPPPAPVLSLVGGNLGLFGDVFVEAYRDFRTQHLAGTASVAELRAHRFWSAVVDAALRARDPDERTEIPMADLVVSFDGDELELLLLTTNATHRPPSGCELVELPSPLGEWRHAIVDSATRSSAKVVAASLTRTITVRGLSRLARQGVIPLAPVLFDFLGVATRADELREARHALVRDDLTVAFQSSFRGQPAGRKPAEGWTFLSGVSMHTFAVGEDHATALDSVWLLQPHLAVARITLSEGIRADDGWLGYGQVLPAVRISGATHVTASWTGGTVELIPAGDDRWRFPARDLDGMIELIARREESVLARAQVRFNAAVASEVYKRPRDLHSFYVESTQGTQPLIAASPAKERDHEADVGLETGRVVLLGAGQGEFVTDEARAAWKVVRLGPTQTIITLPDSPVAGDPPAVRASSPRLRRRWRTLLEQSTTAGGLELQARLAATRRLLHQGMDFPTRDFHLDVLAAPSRNGFPPVASETARLVAAVAGRASARTGLTYSEWRGLVARFLGLPEIAADPDRCAVEALTRSWAEAGYIDVVTAARWRTRIVFALPPSLAVYRCGPAWVGVLVGLCLPNTIRELRDGATAAGVHVEERRSACRFVPSTIVLSSAKIEMLQAAVGTRIPLRSVARDDLTPSSPSVEEGAPPPPNYEKGRDVMPSLTAKDLGQVRITQWTHEYRPPFWVATCGGASIWSYSKNIARLHACRMASVSPFVARDDHDLVVAHGYLPLPIARRVALLGAMLPGPERLEPGGAGHLYAFGTSMFRNRILSAMNV